jgi:hypothetical protein
LKFGNFENKEIIKTPILNFINNRYQNITRFSTIAPYTFDHIEFSNMFENFKSKKKNFLKILNFKKKTIPTTPLIDRLKQQELSFNSSLQAGENSLDSILYEPIINKHIVFDEFYI